MIRQIRDHSDKGFTYVSSSNGITAGEQIYFGLQVWSDLVIASITFADDYNGDSDIEGKTLPAGLYRPMRFKAITITSGTGAAEML
jgi:hypothetical protein